MTDILVLVAVCVVWFLAGLLVALAFGSSQRRKRADGRRRRRGGYLPPGAYTHTNLPTGITVERTRVGISSSIALGKAWADEAERQTPPPKSRRGGHGYFGDAAAGHPGRTPPDSAA